MGLVAPLERASQSCKTDLIRYTEMGIIQKDLVILGGAIKTPPLSLRARREIGFLIRKLQFGLSLEMPRSRSLPLIGSRCHELRVNDGGKAWRVIYRIDTEAIVVLAVFSKKTRKTPKTTIVEAKRLLEMYDA